VRESLTGSVIWGQSILGSNMTHAGVDTIAIDSAETKIYLLTRESIPNGFRLATFNAADGTICKF
jgi:hypothetical protein